VKIYDKAVCYKLNIICYRCVISYVMFTLFVTVLKEIIKDE
jgi:hypothetical protein